MSRVRVHNFSISLDGFATGEGLTLDEQADGKTVLTLRQLHPTAERRAAVIGFGAVELGLQTLQKLARHLGVD